MFEHSIKVPQLYKAVAKVIHKIKNEGCNINSMFYSKQKRLHVNQQAVKALVCETLNRSSLLEDLFKQTELLETEKRLDPILAQVLVTELLWGKKRLGGDSKPVKTILSYEPKLKKYLKSISDQVTTNVKATSDKSEKPRWVRINTLLISIEDAIKEFTKLGFQLVTLDTNTNYDTFISTIKLLKDYEYVRDFHLDELFAFHPKTKFYDTPIYENGQIALQDKASCVAARLLNPSPGSIVLDACAAPGMKTSYLAALMHNKGNIYAIDLHEKRYTELVNLSEKMGVKCAQLKCADFLKTKEQTYPDVEYIIIDPTCSSSGLLTEKIIPENKREDETKRREQLSKFQFQVLRHAMISFPAVRRIVYSTCSIDPIENESVVRDALVASGEQFRLVSARKRLQQTCLINACKDSTLKEHFGSKGDIKTYGPIIGKKILYSRRERDLCNGFFVAVFERKKFSSTIMDHKSKKNIKEGTRIDAKEVTKKNSPYLKRDNKSSRSVNNPNENKKIKNGYKNENIKGTKFVEVDKIRQNKTDTIKRFIENVTELENGEPLKKKRKKIDVLENTEALNTNITDNDTSKKKKKRKRRRKKKVNLTNHTEHTNKSVNGEVPKAEKNINNAKKKKLRAKIKKKQKLQLEQRNVGDSIASDAKCKNHITEVKESISELPQKKKKIKAKG